MTHILLQELDVPDIKNIDVYLQHGGYVGLRKALAQKPAEVIDMVKAAGLRGRGGAGFPTGTKWSFIPKGAPTTFVVVNADESEPGTFKDRQLLEGNPHQVVEGALIAAYAIRARHVYIYCRGEFRDIARDLERRIDEAWANGFIGPNILGSGWDCQVHIHLGAGAYICGEESAMLESIEGKRGEPRIRPPFPATYGLYGQPTVINNVETLSNVPYILDNGVEEYRKLGTQDSPGPKIFCLSGHVKNPGNYELPFGGETTLRKLVFELGGGTPSGLPIKGILPAGASAAILPATDEVLDTPIAYGSFKPWNTDIGSASVIVLDESVDIVWAASKMTRFFEHESCGQCTPCREGTYWLARLYDRIAQGLGDAGDVETLNSVAAQMKGKVICALGEFAANPVMATIQHFPEDYERAIRRQTSEVSTPRPG